MDQDTFQPSYDASSALPEGPEPARPNRVAMFRPLMVRDFAKLWTGLSISLLGDGIYYVALPIQVYAISNVPTALSVVGVAWTLPLVLFLLLGGLISDRFDRRRVMIVADLIRFAAIGSIGLLSVGGVLDLWHIIVLVAFYGIGDALFNPAFGAIVPDVVPQDLLTEANALDQFIKPFMLRLIGPAIGGLLVGLLGPGEAFLIDGATFFVSAAAIYLMRTKARHAAGEVTVASIRSDLATGFNFVRSHPWLWGTLLAAAMALLTFFGPFQVLVPYVIKNELGGSPQDIGWVYAIGGAGGILGAIIVGQRGLPRRHILFMYCSWAVSGLAISGFGLANSLWQMWVASLLMAATNTASMVVWGTLLHRLVPAGMRGRVHSFDWLVSVALVPLSFALTGPIANAVGEQATLVGAGILSASSILVFLGCVKGLRTTERDGSIHPIETAAA
ncbi:MAG: MFS transporter [Actinomycetota bacterium]